jgi:hypothetical protein
MYAEGSIRNLKVMTMPTESQTAQEAQKQSEVLRTMQDMPCQMRSGAEPEDRQRLEQQLRQLEAAYAPYRKPLANVPTDFE